MTAIVSSLAVAAAVWLLALPNEQQPAPPARSVLLDLEKTWDQALAARDIEQIGRLLAEDYTMTDASGARLDRRAYLMSIVRAPDMTRVRTFDSDKLVVRVDGDRATVTGESPIKGRPRGRGYVLDARYRFTDEWAIRDGRWRAVSTSAMLLEK